MEKLKLPLILLGKNKITLSLNKLYFCFLIKYLIGLNYIIIPAATVSFVASSTRMMLPNVLFSL